MILILMGPTGAGKTTVGEILSRELGWEFADADNFHSPENVAKMSKGIGLTDEDRKPWLAALRRKIEQWISAGQNGILACSALREVYRKELSVGPQVKWIYLKGSVEEISQRVAARQGHYAKKELVVSQFAALEEPTNAITIDVGRSPEEIAQEIRRVLGV
ncbi:MAG TPA: gluconokinase [Candidatus Acidoferrales bacterium]|nr:gluconokinase [Candidatus Acidoferrales bacterium]